MRWLVGDVQGCARELEELLQTISFDEHKDELWLLGDLVNRGPDSLEVLRIWHSVGGHGVMGNHDLYAVRVFTGSMERKPSDTLGPLLEAPDAEQLIAELAGMPVLQHLPHDDGPDCWAVHAGVSPAWSDLDAVADRLNRARRDEAFFADPDVAFAITARCVEPNGALCRHKGGPEGCPPGCQPWDALYEGSSLVVHGHWALRGHYRGERTLGLDSSCAHGGKLTAWCQDEDRIVQVPART